MPQVTSHTPRAAPPCQAAPSASSSLCPCATPSRDTSTGGRAWAELEHLTPRVLRGAGISPSPPHPEAPWHLLPMGWHSLLPPFPHLHSALREGRGRGAAGSNLTLGPRQGPLCCPQPLPPQGAASQGEFWPPRSLTEGVGGQTPHPHAQPALPTTSSSSWPLPEAQLPAGVPLPPQKANIQGDGLDAAALPVALALSRADTAARTLRKPEPALGM